jgi:hypothetical protein
MEPVALKGNVYVSIYGQTKVHSYLSPPDGLMVNTQIVEGRSSVVIFDGQLHLPYAGEGSYIKMIANRARYPITRRPAPVSSFVSPGKEPHQPDVVRFFFPRACRRNMLDRSARKHGRHWWRPSPEDVIGLMNLQRMHQYRATASRSVRVAASGKST